MKKIFISIFLIFLFFIHNIVHNIKNDDIKNYKDEKTTDAYLKYKATYNAHKEFADMVFHTIIHRNNIINAFELRDRELLKEYLTLDYKELKKFNIKQLHFHLPNNDSFLRMHRPNKFGDNLTNIRATVKYVNKYKKYIDGFEEGKIFNGFRYVFPIHNKKNKHIGSVEVSFGALLFVKELYANYNMKCGIYINKDVVKQKVFDSEKSNYKQSIFKNYYEQNSIVKYLNKNKLNSINIDDNLLYIINKKLENGTNFSVYKNDKLITFIFLKNPISKKNVAFLRIESKDNFKINKDRNTKILLFLIVMITFIIMLIIYNTIKSKEKIKKDLEEKSRKNIQLEDLSKKLKDNLQIYSDHIIYSKTDLKGDIIEVSDAFCKISQYSKEELIGIKHSIVRSKNISKDVYDNMWNTLRNNKTWVGDIQNISKYGNIYWITSIIYPEYNSSNEKIGYIAIAHNITNTKKLESQHDRLMQAEKLASMGEMITNISHQWRQPLSVISTSATGLILQNEMNNLSKEFLTKTCNIINERSQYLSKTIDDFRNYAIDNESIEKIKVIEIITKFQNLIQYTISKENIHFVYNIEEDLEIQCATNNLIQCFINLFNNSNDAFKLNNIEEKVFIIEAHKESKNIIITIKDNANGIPTEIINKIFEPYFTTKHQSQGTGLGLHMCYNLIVDNMNGNIEVFNVNYEYNNKIFNGSCFKITL